MSLLIQELHERARLALLALKHTPLPEQVAREIEDFFSKNADLERTPLTEAFITSLFMDRLSTAADSAAQNKQVA